MCVYCPVELGSHVVFICFPRDLIIGNRRYYLFAFDGIIVDVPLV